MFPGSFVNQKVDFVDRIKHFSQRLDGFFDNENHSSISNGRICN